MWMISIIGRMFTGLFDGNTLGCSRNANVSRMCPASPEC